jgi:hypothetical protein
MSMPGFTAQASLYRSTRSYDSVVRNASTNGVLPQLPPPIGGGGGVWCSGDCLGSYFNCISNFCRGLSPACYSYCSDRLSRCIDDCFPGQGGLLF